MTAKRKLWVSIMAVVLVLSLLASIALVFADEWIPPAQTPAPTYIPVTTPPQAFTEPGNGEVQDHVDDDGSKEFYTVQTRNGNTFYIVIDKARTDDNVYMLSAVDENDLMKFTEEEQVETTPEVVIQEPEVPEQKPEKKSHGWAWFLLILAAILAVAASLVWKYVLPQRHEQTIDSENMETGELENFPTEEGEVVQEEVNDDDTENES